MTVTLAGKCAVVTGAGRGIGRAIALAMAEDGASVVVNDTGTAMNGSGSSISPADEVVGKIQKSGGKAVANYDSVANFMSAARIINTCTDNFGRIDVLVNNAGTMREKPVFELTEEDWDAVVNVHLKGTFNCTRHASAEMVRQKSGRIINITSGGWLGFPWEASYCAAKGGIVSFTRAIAQDLGPYGVTCNAVAPSAHTRMHGEERRALVEKRMQDRLMSKEEFAVWDSVPGPEFTPSIILYLASDYASNINGLVFFCRGGQISIYSEPIHTKSIYKSGIWTLEELVELMPRSLSEGLVNKWAQKGETSPG